MSKNHSRKARISDSPAGGPTLDIRALDSLLAVFGGQSAAGDVEAAQEIIWDAWDSGDRRRRVALAKKALRKSPLCADAYVLLALETAQTPDKEIDLYRQGVEAGERALGRRAFRDDVGLFWGILETRPYMRARHGLAQALWNAGLHDEALAHYQDMLRLNPNDNQGIRYLLMDCLLALGRDRDARELLNHYKDDSSAAWVWSKAVLLFRRDGDNQASRKALARAINANTHIPLYLLGRKKLPQRLPEYVGIGDENEAVAYVHGAAAVWAAAAGALDWLGNEHAKSFGGGIARRPPANGR